MSSITNMKVTSSYSVKKDLLTVKISKDSGNGKVVNLDDDFNLIFNNEGIPLFLEISNASSIFNANKFSLTRINDIDLTINVEEDEISLEAIFILSMYNKKEVFPFEFKVKNKEKIPKVE